MVVLVELEDVLAINALEDEKNALSEHARSLHATINASSVSYGGAKRIENEGIVRLQKRNQKYGPSVVRSSICPGAASAFFTLETSRTSCHSRETP